MKKYIYRAKDCDNKTYKGILYSHDEKELKLILNKDNLYLTKYKEYKNKSILQDRIKLEDITFFCNQMAMLLKSQMEFIKCLQVITKSVRNKKLLKILNEGIDDIKEGKSFGDTLERYKEFPKFFVNIIKIGEKSGKICKAFEMLKIYYEKNKESKRKLTSAIAYPLVLLTLSIVVLIVMMLKIVPIFTQIFIDFDTEIPLITQIMINISNHLNNQLLYYLLAFIVIIISLELIKQTPKGKYHYDYFKINNIFFKRIYINLFSLTFASGITMLLESGYTHSDAIDEVSYLINNKYLEHKLKKASQNIKNGESLSAAITKINYFPINLLEMLSIGEETNTTVEILTNLEGFYQNEYDYVIKQSINKIEPIMIIGIGALLLFVLMSIFLPMFSIMNTLGSNI